MKQQILINNYILTEDGSKEPVPAVDGVVFRGTPAGGSVTGTGISIVWQDGPLGRGAERIPPNGAFVEGVIEAAISRLQFYQNSRFNCRENSVALTHLETALLWLNKRTQDREDRQVEGTHVV